MIITTPPMSVFTPSKVTFTGPPASCVPPSSKVALSAADSPLAISTGPSEKLPEASVVAELPPPVTTAPDIPAPCSSWTVPEMVTSYTSSCLTCNTMGGAVAAAAIGLQLACPETTTPLPSVIVAVIATDVPSLCLKAGSV